MDGEQPGPTSSTPTDAIPHSPFKLAPSRSPTTPTTSDPQKADDNLPAPRKSMWWPETQPNTEGSEELPMLHICMHKQSFEDMRYPYDCSIAVKVSGTALDKLTEPFDCLVIQRDGIVVYLCFERPISSNQLLVDSSAFMHIQCEKSHPYLDGDNLISVLHSIHAGKKTAASFLDGNVLSMSVTLANAKLLYEKSELSKLQDLGTINVLIGMDYWTE
jgi:hypothetical protein